MQTMLLAWSHHGPMTWTAWRAIAGPRRFIGPVTAFLVTLLLLSMLPSMAAVPTIAGEPRPLPAPAPLIVDELASRGS